MEYFSANELISLTLQKDLEREAERVKADDEARRLLALTRSSDPGVIVGTSALVAKLSERLEQKITKAPGSPAPDPAPEVKEEKDVKRANHFPAPPRLGST